MDPFPPSSPPFSSPQALRWLPNPFTTDVCTTPFEVEEAHSVNAMNRDVLQRVAGAIEEVGDPDGTGRFGKPLLLLTAPRAGYGKTHLLGRVAAVAETQSVVMPLVFRSDAEITWAEVSREAVEVLRHLPGKAEGWFRLREVCAGIISSMVLQLIREGRLPCANQEQALRVLSGDATELFREGTSAKLIGDWLKKHYPQLRKPLCDQARALPNSGAMESWLDALFAAAHHGTPVAMETVVALASGSRPAFELWLRLVALWRPVVLFVDHLDGFYRQEGSGIRIATMLLELSELEGVHVVLSLNQDVWQASFAHHLPSAMEDRLTASQFLLRGLSTADAVDLVRLRMTEVAVPVDDAQQFEAFLHLSRYFQGRPVGSVAARAFLRHCAMQWDAFVQMKARGETFPPPPSSDEPDEPAESLLPDEGPGFSLMDSLRSETPIFGSDDTSFLKSAASSLSEPAPAMVNTPFSLVPQQAPPPPPSAPIQPKPGFNAANGLTAATPFAVATPAPAPIPHPDWNGQAAPNLQPRAPGAMEKLRDMMDRLRTPPAAAPTPVASLPPASTGVAARLADVLNDVAVPPASAQDLLARFESLRNEMANEALLRPLDLAKMDDLIRLAGKRFPLVRFDEVPLPNNPGKSLPRWTLQGLEILFGLGEFTDQPYWRSLGNLAAARIAELRASPPDGPVHQLKLIAMKSDRETLAWTSLQSSLAIPETVKPHMEVLHLDARSLAALYATQRMIAEAENGVLNATPSQVMSLLARELNFFWKRVTRPL